MWRTSTALKQHPSGTLANDSILPSKYFGILKEQVNYIAENEAFYMGQKKLSLGNATKLREEHSEILAVLGIRTMI